MTERLDWEPRPESDLHIVAFSRSSASLYMTASDPPHGYVYERLRGGTSLLSHVLSGDVEPWLRDIEAWIARYEEAAKTKGGRVARQVRSPQARRSARRRGDAAREVAPHRGEERRGMSSASIGISWSMTGVIEEVGDLDEEGVTVRGVRLRLDDGTRTILARDDVRDLRALGGHVGERIVFSLSIHPERAA